jgi:hypothetical protein
MDMAISPGGKRTVSYEGLATVAIEDPKIVDVKILMPGIFQIRGRHLGATAITVTKSDGQRQVVNVTVASGTEPEDPPDAPDLGAAPSNDTARQAAPPPPAAPPVEAKPPPKKRPTSRPADLPYAPDKSR